LANLAVTLLAALPVQAQEDAAFRCTFKAVFETIESDSPGKSSHEKQFVGHRMDVPVTGQSTAQAAASTTITLMHIRTWSEPVRFTFAWGSTLAVGTCEKLS
jgi:hypothetical protein